MKVWILEKFISPDEMKKDHDEMVEICHHFAETGEATPEAIAHVEEGIKKYESKMAENPNGYWCGYQGKINYRDFCECAKETMRHLKGSTFRVVKADIENTAQTWNGYKNPEVNAGVLRYLYATL